MTGRVVRFGSFEVDLRAGEVRKRGRIIRLQEQPFQVLQALLEQPGDVVSREALRARLWPADTFVDFDNGLNNAVNKVRGALGDSAAAPKYVETVGRRGYRFIGTIDERPADAAQGGQTPAGGSAQRRSRSAGTFQTASSAIFAVIFECPSRRSRNRIGTSVTVKPAWIAR